MEYGQKRGYFGTRKNVKNEYAVKAVVIINLRSIATAKAVLLLLSSLLQEEW